MVLPWASHQRYAACKLAKVDPEYVDYEGDDPDTYALTVNVARRQMSKGQLAMVVAKAEGLFATNNQEYVAKAIGVSRPRVAYVAIVLKWAPELVDSVIEGASLDEAYDFAHARKVEADNAERTEADGSPWSCSDVESEVAFIIDQNIARRHLTQSQRHALAVEMAPMFETEAAARRAQAPGKQRGQKTSERPNVAGQKGDDDGRALGQAAKKMGTSPLWCPGSQEGQGEGPSPLRVHQGREGHDA